MKYLLFSIISVLSFSVFAADGYEEPPNACYEGCTPWMQNLLNNFENHGVKVELTPAVYSGECHHLGGTYDPDYAHHAVVMIDDNDVKPGPYFSTIFSFYENEDSFASWDLTTSRQEMSSYWKEHGDFIFGKTTSRVEVRYDSGGIAYAYYLRQNPATKDLYYITYAGISSIAFCELKKH